jgi:deoxyribodipyrimidine photo-lyase
MKNAGPPIIVLFRNDLRTADNKALAAAAESGRPVLPLYVHDEGGTRPAGAASRWWLHHSLASLCRSMEDLGAPLVLSQGDARRVLAETIKTTGADTVLWNRRYTPSGAAADAAMEQRLRKDGLHAESFDGFLLHEPPEVANKSGEFYKVFTPFYKNLASGDDPRDPVDAPAALTACKTRMPSEKLDALGLLPRKPDWSGGLAERWRPGEGGAHDRLEEFVGERLDGYSRNRDLPGTDGTSCLSPHLAHGEITPFQIMAALRRRRSADAETFRKELAWREFSYHLLCHFPDLNKKSFRPEFEAFGWRTGPSALRAWQRGATGYPIVDAGMRQLWRTGWMHNRVRMIAASFLIKDLLIDWRTGEEWFWDTLVDADPANNAASWQWVAGSGADAAPYFRIFNPVLQGEKFDPEGAYVRHYVPELAGLPDRYVHRPWEAPQSVLKSAGIELGRHYPLPVVDHAEARERAMSAYRSIRAG